MTTSTVDSKEEEIKQGVESKDEAQLLIISLESLERVQKQLDVLN